MVLLWISFAALSGLTVFAQTRRNPDWGWRGWWNRVPPRFPDQEDLKERSFTFARVMYQSVRDEPLGHGWNTDYPNSDVNFMIRLSELTKARVALDGEGMPNHVVVTLTDDALFNYPFIFMSDVGTAGFTEIEAERLRDYLKRGGILYVDDFWGTSAWDHWSREIGRVLPPDEYPIVDIPPDHPVLQMFFTVRKIPQVPSIQFWRRSGGTSTSERGYDSEQPHFRGIFDAERRLMVIMTHNTDIADGWEREGEDDEFFYRFSIRAYPLGVNIAIYAMTH
ncbi:MAG TPA: DUF4159 domain-containing protein [Vicinamibacteria bacterium]|nr:DUF4159 domain-containing protein [Vicinamibacteria bacterium]